MLIPFCVKLVYEHLNSHSQKYQKFGLSEGSWSQLKIDGISKVDSTFLNG
jgi:hypothetical protein